MRTSWRSRTPTYSPTSGSSSPTPPSATVTDRPPCRIFGLSLMVTEPRQGRHGGQRLGRNSTFVLNVLRSGVVVDNSRHHHGRLLHPGHHQRLFRHPVRYHDSAAGGRRHHHAFQLAECISGNTGNGPTPSAAPTASLRLSSIPSEVRRGLQGRAGADGTDWH